MTNKTIKILMLLCVLCASAVNISFAQDSSKYHGGSYDGFSIGNVSQTGLGGININLAKYFGGSFDGFALNNISQTGLGGISIDLAKYFGGSYDGFALNNISQTGLGGISIDLAKYFGGSYDGFALNNISQTGLGGININLAKYFGGSFDGFALNNISQTGLNGLAVNLAKYFGGSFDGFALNNISQTGLGGQTSNLAKYFGGSFDGFAVNTTALIPLNGGNMKLKLTALMEGFYNSSTNRLIRDTVKVYVRVVSSPYTLVDSAKVVLDSLGQVNIDFYNAPTGTYFIVIEHRNSIETWSKSGGTQLSSGGVLNIYDFTISQNQAYGNNLVLKGTRYCIYSGNPNQDDVVDGTDLALIDNDASNFTIGYVQTDVNGDQLVDGSDLSITDNNASNFVSVIRPPGAVDRIVIKNFKNNPSKTNFKNLNGK